MLHVANDTADPEISTLSTLTNVQNSLFIPDLGPLLNRMPTYTLTRRPSKAVEGLDATQRKPEPAVAEEPLQAVEERPPAVTSMTSVLGPERFAVLPDGANLDGWTQEEIEEMNDHVRHMLHSRRSKFKRAMRGFGQYVKRRKCSILYSYEKAMTNNKQALGFLVTLYATLITLFGLAWVLFLIGTFSFPLSNACQLQHSNSVQVGLTSAKNDYMSSMSLTMCSWPSLPSWVMAWHHSELSTPTT